MSADFQLGDWVVRPQRRLIERGDDAVHIKPKPMAVLECLAAAGGEPVTRNELFDTVWPGGTVSDDTLTACISELRKAFGDTARESRVIETIPKTGFRLVLPVSAVTPEPQREAHPSADGARAIHSFPGNRRRVILFSLTTLLLLVVALAIPGTRTWLVGEFLTSSPNMTDSPLEQHPGIAVLPFVNMSNDPDTEYFSDGISEELLNALANSNRIPVIARTSSFRFKDQNRGVTEIGRLLGVTDVLEGSVRRAGSEVRVTAHLIDAITGKQKWSNAYQRHMRDIFALQREITADIVEQIGTALEGSIATGPGGQLVPADRTRNPDAYNLYLKGMQLLSNNNPAPRARAVAYFERAIALDSDYADAWAGKGKALYELGNPNYGNNRIPASIYPEAIAAFQRALEIDPQNAFALGWLGMSLIRNDFKWAEGMELLKRSVTLNPNNADQLSNYGIYLQRMNMEGSEAVLDRAFRLDPYGFWPITIRANSLYRKGLWLDAARVMETSLIGDPDGYAPNFLSAVFNVGAGRGEAAEIYIRKARQVAHPVDLCLDMFQWAADSLREGGGEQECCEPSREQVWQQIWERSQTEHACHFGAYALRSGLGSEDVVRAFELMIKQRHAHVAGHLFGQRPKQIPEADWQRMKEMTGVAQFQSRQKKHTDPW